MSASKKLLEKKNDQELLNQLENDNLDPPELNALAFELLQERGHVFDPREKARIKNQIIHKQNNYKACIHPYYKISAYTIFLSVMLGVVQLAINYKIITFYTNSIIDIVGLALLLVLGVLTYRGSESVKYIFLPLFILGLSGILSLVLNHRMNPLFNLISLIQCLLQIGAILLLFLVPKRFKL